MGGINLSIHPLFFVFGFYYALTGKIFIFIIYTVCAVIHELGHSIVAANAGYRLNKITLMPFGAVVSGNIDGLKPQDEIKIALAGPFLNLSIGLFFVATWWIYPESYAFTDIVAEANFSMALVNFIPAAPLDGGRVVSALLKDKFGEKKAQKLVKILCVVFSILLAAGFILTMFSECNLSLLLFLLFVIFGAFGKNKENRYIKLYTALTVEKLKRGMDIKRQALHQSATVKKMLSILDVNAVNEIVVYDDEKRVGYLTESAINDLIEKGDIYAPLSKYI